MLRSSALRSCNNEAILSIGLTAHSVALDADESPTGSPPVTGQDEMEAGWTRTEDLPLTRRLLAVVRGLDQQRQLCIRPHQPHHYASEAAVSHHV
jgi:hypothetical protein